RVLKEEPATARRIRHAVGIEPGEEERKVPGGHREDRDIAVAHGPRSAVEWVGDPYAAGRHEPAEVARQCAAREGAVLLRAVLGHIRERDGQHVHARARVPVAARLERLLEDAPGRRIELPAIRRSAEKRLEPVIEPPDERWRAPEV